MHASKLMGHKFSHNFYLVLALLNCLINFKDFVVPGSFLIPYSFHVLYTYEISLRNLSSATA